MPISHLEGSRTAYSCEIGVIVVLTALCPVADMVSIINLKINMADETRQSCRSLHSRASLQGQQTTWKRIRSPELPVNM